MPHFELEGVDRNTGEPIVETVEADSEDRALREVGFLVSGIREVPKPIPKTAPASVPTKPKPDPAVEFVTMEAAESVMAIIAALGLIVGAIVSIVGISGIVNAGESYLSDEAAETAQGFAMLTVGISCFFAGVLFAGFAFVLKALRVIAVNSYNKAS